MFTAFLLSFLIFTNLPETQKLAVEMLNEKGVEAKLTDRGIVFFAPGLLFDLGESHIPDNSIDQIDIIVQVLDINGIDDDLVYFEGHTDSSGDPDLNLVLGQLRAQNAQSMFHQAGLNPKRTLVASYGDTIPISEDPAKNRRVEVVVVDSE